MIKTANKTKFLDKVLFFLDDFAGRNGSEGQSVNPAQGYGPLDFNEETGQWSIPVGVGQEPETAKKEPGLKLERKKEQTPGVDVNPDPVDIDWSGLALGAGAGLLSHSLVDSLFDKTDNDRKKRSVWYDILRRVAPIAAGGIGAYGGYRLGNLLKSGSEKRAALSNPVEVGGNVLYGLRPEEAKTLSEWIGKYGPRAESLNELPDIATSAANRGSVMSGSLAAGLGLEGLVHSLYGAKQGWRSLFGGNNQSSIFADLYKAKDRISTRRNMKATEKELAANKDKLLAGKNRMSMIDRNTPTDDLGRIAKEVAANLQSAANAETGGKIRVLTDKLENLRNKVTKYGPYEYSGLKNLGKAGLNAAFALFSLRGAKKGFEKYRKDREHAMNVGQQAEEIKKRLDSQPSQRMVDSARTNLVNTASSGK